VVVAGVSALVANMTSATLLDGMQRPQREGDQLVGTIRTSASVATIGWISAGVSALFTILALGFGW
jgi:cation transporter-like permease